jgi:hypothetical protein
VTLINCTLQPADAENRPDRVCKLHPAFLSPAEEVSMH